MHMPTQGYFNCETSLQHGSHGARLLQHSQHAGSRRYRPGARGAAVNLSHPRAIRPVPAFLIRVLLRLPLLLLMPVALLFHPVR